jgi:hypothetical protein
MLREFKKDMYVRRFRTISHDTLMDTYPVRSKHLWINDRALELVTEKVLYLFYCYLSNRLGYTSNRFAGDRDNLIHYIKYYQREYPLFELGREEEELKNAISPAYILKEGFEMNEDCELSIIRFRVIRRCAVAVDSLKVCSIIQCGVNELIHGVDSYYISYFNTSKRCNIDVTQYRSDPNILIFYYDDVKERTNRIAEKKKKAHRRLDKELNRRYSKHSLEPLSDDTEDTSSDHTSDEPNDIPDSDAAYLDMDIDIESDSD